MRRPNQWAERHWNALYDWGKLQGQVRFRSVYDYKTLLWQHTSHTYMDRFHRVKNIVKKQNACCFLTKRIVTYQIYWRVLQSTSSAHAASLNGVYPSSISHDHQVENRQLVSPFPLFPNYIFFTLMLQSEQSCCSTVVLTTSSRYVALRCLLQFPSQTSWGENSSECSRLTCLPVSLHALVFTVAPRRGGTGRKACR